MDTFEDEPLRTRDPHKHTIRKILTPSLLEQALHSVEIRQTEDDKDQPRELEQSEELQVNRGILAMV